MQLAVLFITALVIASAGFKKYIYFFSVGYGFSVAGIAIAVLVMSAFNANTAVVPMCLVLIIYGARLGGYLLYREMKSKAYRSLLNGEIKHNVSLKAKLSIWLGCALLYVCMTCPVLFRLLSGKGTDAFSVIGLLLMIAGAATELAADIHKSAAKKKAPHSFVSTGLYSIVRCPNYFGELVLWTGVFITGINVYSAAWHWMLAVIGYLGIIYVMFSGARRLEIRQQRTYGNDDSYRDYVRRVPIILPLVPLYSVYKYRWLVA